MVTAMSVSEYLFLFHEQGTSFFFKKCKYYAYSMRIYGLNVVLVGGNMAMPVSGTKYRSCLLASHAAHAVYILSRDGIEASVFFL